MLPIVFSIVKSHSATASSGNAAHLRNGYFLLTIIASLICNSLQETEEALKIASIELSATSDTEQILEITMPDARPDKKDQLLCTAINIEEYGTQYVHSFEAISNSNRTQSMILFTCDDVDVPDYYLMEKAMWNCYMHYPACKRMRIMYSWGKNAPPTILPKDVGFRLGPESNVKNLILMAYYAHPFPEGLTDRSGFRLQLSPEKPKWFAGIMSLYRFSLDIPPLQEKIYGRINCALKSNSSIHPFAYRVHTHKLGVVVSGYKVDPTTKKTDLIGKGNPQWPQAFYPTEAQITINPKDYVVAQCTFSTRNFTEPTEIGIMTGDNEMCNFYILYYTVSTNPDDHSLTCMDEENPEITQNLPIDFDEPLPRNETLEEQAMDHTDYFSEPINFSSENSWWCTHKGSGVLAFIENAGTAISVIFVVSLIVIVVIVLCFCSSNNNQKRENIWHTDTALNQVYKQHVPMQFKPDIVLGTNFQNECEQTLLSTPTASVFSNGELFRVEGDGGNFMLDSSCKVKIPPNSNRI